MQFKNWLQISVFQNHVFRSLSAALCEVLNFNMRLMIESFPLLGLPGQNTRLSFRHTVYKTHATAESDNSQDEELIVSSLLSVCMLWAPKNLRLRISEDKLNTNQTTDRQWVTTIHNQPPDISNSGSSSHPMLTLFGVFVSFQGKNYLAPGNHRQERSQ